jgi:hypothetical protein
MKILFRKSNGKLLGAQALGEDNVDKRISALAMALQLGATVYDLEESELCYAPQFGSAKDPVNFAGMVAADVLRDDMPISHWTSGTAGFLLDVREPVELAVESEPRDQHPIGSTALAPGRASPRPGHSRDLPLRRTRLLRDADPAAGRVQCQDAVRRNAVANPRRELLGELNQTSNGLPCAASDLRHGVAAAARRGHNRSPCRA